MTNQAGVRRDRSIGQRAGSCLESLLVAGIFLLVGGGLTYWGWTILENAKASASWPTAQGEVIKSEVTRNTDGEGHTSYSPEVTYTYFADNQSRKSYTIKFGENSYGNKRTADEIAAKYPIGKSVTVFYDPQNPEKSVLEPGVSSGSYIVLGIGVLFVVISLLVPIIAFFFGSGDS